MTPGVAGYPGQFGNVLIKKESFDKFINTMVGVPVIINHKDITTKNANDERVGVVSNVWFDDKDGWYWCDGVIWDETAQNLITDKGWSVSCSYDVKLADDAGGTENNIPYDIEFLDGVFTHLAIVDNPRYERANIVFNSKTVIENGGKGSGNFDHDGRPEQVGGSLPYDSKLSDKQNEAFFKKWENAPEIKLKPSDWDNISDIKKLRQEVKKYLLSDMRKIPLHRKELGDIRFSGKSIDEFITYSADRDKLLAAKQLPQFIEEGKLGEYFDSPKDRSKQDTIKGFYPIYFNLKTSTNTRKAEILIAKDDNGKLFFDMFLDYDRDKAQLKRALNGNLNPVALNNIITDNRENFNPDIKNNVQNNKEQDMALIDELKKLITKVENDKGEDMDGNEVKNEKVDKREILREADAIAMKPASEFKGGAEEKFRTLTKKMEELGYDKSEAGTADNACDDEEEVKNKKVKNEETKEDEKKYDDLKKDVKEDVQNKCKNSVDNAKGGYFDKMNEIYNTATQPSEENTYISREQKLKYAEEYFAK